MIDVDELETLCKQKGSPSMEKRKHNSLLPCWRIGIKHKVQLLIILTGLHRWRFRPLHSQARNPLRKMAIE